MPYYDLLHRPGGMMGPSSFLPTERQQQIDPRSFNREDAIRAYAESRRGVDPGFGMPPPRNIDPGFGIPTPPGNVDPGFSEPPDLEGIYKELTRRFGKQRAGLIMRYLMNERR